MAKTIPEIPIAEILALGVDRERISCVSNFRWPPARRVFLLHKLRRAIATAMPYLLMTAIVCGLVAWFRLSEATTEARSPYLTREKHDNGRSVGRPAFRPHVSCTGTAELAGSSVARNCAVHRRRSAAA